MTPRWRLYVEAARNLEARQVLRRPLRRVPPILFALAGAGRAPSVWRSLAGGLGADEAPQSGPTPPPHENGVFHAFGKQRSVSSADFWSGSSEGLLFLFHLHGFSALASYAAGAQNREGDAFWADLVLDWIERHRRPQLPAWHPYPTSSRLIAFCSALSGVRGWSPRVRETVAESAWRQMRYLRWRVEHEVGGNHVIHNAAALMFGAATFDDRRMLRRALALLEKEVARQVLADGAHAERSPAYHRVVRLELANVATLIERVGDRIPGWLANACAAMDRWEVAMSGPDGSLPLFNDAWVVPKRVAGTRGLDELRESGFVVLRHNRDQLIFDVGELTPPHLPPHAHADALSFVLWADGRLLVVDPGAFTYTGPRRDSFRATRAHSTVEVDGQNQCFFWGDFRHAFAPRVSDPVIKPQDDVVVVTAAHDGYRRLDDPVVHERAVVWLPGDGVVILDRLHARRKHRIRSRLPLAPDLTDARPTRLGPFRVAALGGAAARMTEAAYSPWLGTSMSSSALEVVQDVAPGESFGWSLLRAGAHVQGLTERSLRMVRGSGISLSLDPPIGDPGDIRWD